MTAPRKPLPADGSLGASDADDAIIVVHLDDDEPVELRRADIAAARQNPSLAADNPTLRAYLEAVPAHADPTDA